MKQAISIFPLAAVLYSCGNNGESIGLSYRRIMVSADLLTEFIQSLK